MPQNIPRSMADLRAAARTVFERIDRLSVGWAPGLVREAELDELTRAVGELRADLELHATRDHPAGAEDVVALVAVREGVDAAITIVLGLLERSTAREDRTAEDLAAQRDRSEIGSPSAGNGPVP